MRLWGVESVRRAVLGSRCIVLYCIVLSCVVLGCVHIMLCSYYVVFVFIWLDFSWEGTKSTCYSSFFCSEVYLIWTSFSAQICMVCNFVFFLFRFICSGASLSVPLPPQLTTSQHTLTKTLHQHHIVLTVLQILVLFILILVILKWMKVSVRQYGLEPLGIKSQKCGGIAKLKSNI